jgi:hypothetical protein
MRSSKPTHQPSRRNLVPDARVDRGNRMSPTYSNKRGARYRYYVSQAVLQKQPRAHGSVGRVPAAEVEALVVAALRNHLNASGSGAQLRGTVLWKARGELPKDMIEVEVRHMAITYVQFMIVWQAAHNWLSPLIAASASNCC